MTRLVAFAALLSFGGGFGLRKLSAPPPAEPAHFQATNGRAEAPAITAGATLTDATDNSGSPLAGDWPEAAGERLEANDARGSAVAFLRWLKGVDGATLRMAMERMAKREHREPLMERAGAQGLTGLLSACLARWGEFAPDEAFAWMSERSEVRTDYYPAVYASWLKSDDAAAMAHAEANPARRYDQSMADFCRRYLAACHPEFDLGWAIGNGVPVEWFTRMWLARGIDPENLLAELGQLDANARTEVTGAVFSHLASEREKSHAQLVTLLEGLDDPALVEAAREAIGKAARTVEASRQPLALYRLLTELEITIPSHPEGLNVERSGFAVMAARDDPEGFLAYLRGETDPIKRRGFVFPLFASLDERIATNPAWLDLYLTSENEEIPHLRNVASFVGWQAHTKSEGDSLVDGEG